MSRTLVLVLAQSLALLVTTVLATVGSWGLGFGVMTDCTNTTPDCGLPQLLLVVGWVAQGLLLATAVALCTPRVARRLGRRLPAAALAVALVSVLAFAGTAWSSSQAYCRGEPSGEDYCDVRL